MASARYAYLNTRISMLAARLLSPEQCEALVVQPEVDYSGIEGLENYAELVARASGSTRLVEQALLRGVLEDARVIVRSLAPTDRLFIEYSLRWYELANLKALFRGKFTGLDSATIRGYLIDTAPFTTLPMEEMLATEDPAELLRLLERTSYEDIARHARRVFEERQDIFSLEAAIDRRFMQGLRLRALAVDSDQQQGLRLLIGTLFDHFNITWLLRFRLAYGLSPAETFYLLLPSGHLLDSRRLEDIAKLASLEEIAEAQPEPIRGILAASGTIPDVERRLQSRLRGLLREAIADTRFPIVRAFAYIVRRELQMTNLLCVVKGRNLGFATGLIRYAADLKVH